jgi:predicted NBD/HSP70 family sugar kinase
MNEIDPEVHISIVAENTCTCMLLAEYTSAQEGLRVFIRLYVVTGLR